MATSTGITAADVALGALSALRRLGAVLPDERLTQAWAGGAEDAEVGHPAQPPGHPRS